MNRENYELWERINNYSFDDEKSSLKFSERLCNENLWSKEYTQRVINEYKKFIFLALKSGHKVTPSDEIDQVWHLHMLYTEEYWNNFCKNVLKSDLHHGPTKGGNKENKKFEDWYEKTKRSYQLIFVRKPPVDIWPPSNIRFEKRFIRICTQDHLIIHIKSYPRISKLIVKILNFLKKCGL